MIRLAADENVDNDVVRALRRRRPGVDLIRVQDAGLAGASDPTILEWAAGEGRIVVTHDVATMIEHAAVRVRAGLPMPGLFVVPVGAAIARVVDDLLLVDECSEPSEWEGRIAFLPLG